MHPSVIWFHSSSSLLFAVWISFQVFCPVVVSWMSKKTKNDFFSTHCPCQQRRKSLSTYYFSVYSRTIASLNSTEWENVWLTYKKLGNFGASYSSLSHFARAYLCLTSFTERILSRSCLSYVRYDLGSILGCLSSHDVMTRSLRLQGLINISASESGEKVYYPIPPPGVFLRKYIRGIRGQS